MEPGGANSPPQAHALSALMVHTCGPWRTVAPPGGGSGVAWKRLVNQSTHSKESSVQACRRRTAKLQFQTHGSRLVMCLHDIPQTREAIGVHCLRMTLARISLKPATVVDMHDQVRACYKQCRS